MRFPIVFSIVCGLMNVACNKAPSETAQAGAVKDKKISPTAKAVTQPPAKSKSVTEKTPSKASTVGKNKAVFELRIVQKGEQGEQFESWGDGKAHFLGAPIVGLTDVKSAKVVTDALGKKALAIELKEAAATRLQTETEKSVGQRLAFIVQGKVVNAPAIKEKIGGGRLNISLADIPEGELKLDVLVKTATPAPAK